MINYLNDLIIQSPEQLISYADYINAVLYHPVHGYYMKNKQKIGTSGDFITTSNISDIFGRTIAKWFGYICEQNKLAPIFCEVGGGNGRFARAFLEEWNENVKRPLKYIIVETSPYHRQLQEELLKENFSFEQAESMGELSPFEGMIFSNELFDALPVHVIEKENDELFEVMVGITESGLFEKKVPLTNPDIQGFLLENKLELKEKQRIEVPLLLAGMLEKMDKALTKGFITTIDYGYTNEEWMEPSRRKGSLRGYYQHEMIENVLLHPGEMDITTHIHFDWLIKKGNQLGINFIEKLRQDEFLLRTGILEDLQNHYDPNPFSAKAKRNRAIRSLIMPTSMSSYFHVLIQQKALQTSADKLFPYKK